MDAELKASMDNVRLLAVQRRSQESTTTSEPEVWQPPNPEQHRVKLEQMVSKKLSYCLPQRLMPAKEECLPFVPKGLNLFITGPAGTGKSYMAAALVRGAVQRKAEEHLQEAYLRAKEVGRYEPQPFNTPPFGWVTIPELMLSLRSSFREGARQTEEEIISRYSDVTLLVLDDLGAEKSSDFAIQSLYLIIDRRYSREQQTIITSNLSLGEIAEKIGDRIASRIAGMCKVVELKGKDRRLP